jgi:hypothetical protein
MKMTCLNRLAQRVGQNRQILPHFTRTLALVQQSLRLGLHFRSQNRGGAPTTRCKETLRSLVPVKLHLAFHRRQGNAKRASDLAVAHVPVGNHLAGEQPEARQVVRGMFKHRQKTVDVHYST